MIAKVLKTYKDKTTGSLRHKDTLIEVTDERFAEINSTSRGTFLEEHRFEKETDDFKENDGDDGSKETDSGEESDGDDGSKETDGTGDNKAPGKKSTSKK